MEENNKLNTLYFESSTMKGLYDTIETWQVENQKRLLSLNIQKDGDNFCCIALTNPTEVIIADGSPYGENFVVVFPSYTRNGYYYAAKLNVTHKP